MEDTGVYRKSLHAGKWYMASVFGQKAIGLAMFFVLARLLAPMDYGIIAIVMVVVTPLNQLTTVSFGDALVQRKESIEKYLDPLWTLDLARACALAALIFAFGPALSSFFHVTDPALVALIRFSGLLLVIPALANIRMIYLFKEMDLRRIFFRDVFAQAASAAVAVLYAVLVQRSAWALFLGALAQSAVGVIASYALYPARPAVSFDFRVLLDLLGFSKWIYGQEVLDVLLAQLDKLFVGRLLAAAELGMYAKAKDLASTATNTVASMISKVGFAAFAKVQDHLDKVQEGFVKSIDVIVLSGLPFTLLLLIEGGAIVSFFLGAKWVGIVEPLKIFAFGNLLLAFTSIVSPILAALGRPDINFKTNLLRIIVTVPFMYAGYVLAGLNGLAWAVVATWVIMSVYILIRTKRVLRMHRNLFYPVLASGSAACAATVILDLVLRFFLHEPRGHALDFLVFCLLGASYFLILILVGKRLGKGPSHTAFSVLREFRILPPPRAAAPSGTSDE